MRSQPVRGILPALLLAAALSACDDDGATSATGGGGDDAGSGGAGSAGPASSGAATASSTSTGAGGDPSSFSIIAWNVESFPKTHHAAGIMTSVIGTELPTIAAFEEVEDVQLLEESLDAVTDYQVVTENEPPYALVAAVDTTRATILDSGSIFSDDSYLFPRAPLVVRIAVGSPAAAGFELDLVVVHQKAQLDEESEQRRRDGNERLAQWCAQRFASTQAPIVLVGDFNDQVTDTGANDVFTAFKTGTDPDYWFLTAESEEDGEYSYVPFTSFIDHQIATGNLRDTFPLARTAVLHLEAEVADYVDRVTDHLPVRVDFSQ
jgi:endonuclease/exonuclease/phosphatase family metal-dependent hydrolase